MGVIVISDSLDFPAELIKFWRERNCGELQTGCMNNLISHPVVPWEGDVTFKFTTQVEL